MHKKAADVPNMPFCSSLSYFFRHVNYNRGSQSEFRRKINQQIKFDGYFLFSWCLPSDDNKKLNTATIAYCYALLNYNQWFSDSKQYTIYLRHNVSYALNSNLSQTVIIKIEMHIYQSQFISSSLNFKEDMKISKN